MSETKWTDEQQQAIDTRKCNLLVAAAAGSGKTAVLSERVFPSILENLAIPKSMTLIVPSSKSIMFCGFISL